MKNKKYIMIGAPIITREIFRNILRPLNNYSFKPSGGFWASEYISNIYDISPWYTHLKHDATSIARYKNINQSTIFTLKDNVKILIIDSAEKILKLAKKYPSYHHTLGHLREITEYNTIFDFEKLSQDFDGIYINANYFNNQFKTTVFDNIRVNSLLLFNLDCIKEFQTAPIIFDIEQKHSIPYINNETIGNPQTIIDESYEHKLLTKFTKELFLESVNKYTDYHFIDYDEYLQTITKILKNIIEITKETQSQKVTKIIKYLKSQNMRVKAELLIQSIILNYLAEYLSQDEKRIKTLSKSKIKQPKTYHIF